ncbi:MAG: 2-hydroxyglutaryl-CoA dehydratase [Thermodesulfobacteria bacterium]|nr:2-hydroxyglutaryl-CoA dehydratase [Thermodesulfobacteriota bacterium]
MYFVGIDIGSTTTKLVVIDESKEIVFSEVLPTSSVPLRAVQTLFDKALSKIDKTKVKTIIATGYGRHTVPFADKAVTEITCHAVGIFTLNKQARTIIDIGGQDSKVIRLDEFGNVENFKMNDKCAAGTGKFLEVIANRLEVNLEEFGQLALRSKHPAQISSVCAVFAESEVVSLLASGADKIDIAAGIHLSIADRVGAMAKSIGVKPEVVFTGGVAQNPGVKFFLEKVLGVKVSLPGISPYLTGALGAAILGLNAVRS